MLLLLSISMWQCSKDDLTTGPVVSTNDLTGNVTGGADDLFIVQIAQNHTMGRALAQTAVFLDSNAVILP